MDDKSSLPFERMRASPELSYVIGAVLGDGCFSYKKSRREYAIRLACWDREFAEKFERYLAILLGRMHKIAKYKELFVVKASCKLLYTILNKAKHDLFVLSPYVEKFPIYFIQGFADAEGSVNVYLRKGNNNIRLKVLIRIYNSRRDLLEYMSHLLKQLGINSNIYLHARAGQSTNVRGRLVTYRRDSYHICIYKQNDVMRFAEKIGFTIQRKNLELEKGIKLIEEHSRRWLNREIDVVRCYYGRVSREEMRKMLPRHTWEAIKRIAYVLRRNGESIAKYE